MSAGEIVGSVESITLVQAKHRRLAKTIRADGTVEDYDSARTINLASRAIADLEALHRLLCRLCGRPDIAVVRGAIADPEMTQRVRRLLHADFQTGETPTLTEVPRSWLALDIDGVDRPAAIPTTDLAGCARHALQQLPEVFSDARCIAQASASHGIKPGVRMRLWFWLSRPTTGSELKRWLRGTPTDPSVFSAAQLIYTASPIFAAGLVDLLPDRIVKIPGTKEVAVPPPIDLAQPPHAPASLPIIKSVYGDRYSFAALRNAVARVASASVGNRHATVLAEARGLARFVEAGLLSNIEVRAALCAAAALAGKPDAEISSLLDWAFEHPSVAGLPPVTAR